MTEIIPIEQYHITDNDILIDLRDSRSFSFGSLNGAVNISFDEIEKLYALPQDKRIVLFCQSGDYSSEIAELLSDNGYDTVDLEGGWRRYIKYEFSKGDKNV